VRQVGDQPRLERFYLGSLMQLSVTPLRKPHKIHREMSLSSNQYIPSPLI